MSRRSFINSIIGLLEEEIVLLDTSEKVIDALKKVLVPDGKRVVILATCGCDESTIQHCSFAVDEKKMREMVKLYQSYDFSEKVTLMSDSPCYGSLFNYVKTGIMTEEEMLDALLN